jgi:hypothetical protein
VEAIGHGTVKQQEESEGADSGLTQTAIHPSPMSDPGTDDRKDREPIKTVRMMSPRKRNFVARRLKLLFG